MASGNFKRSTAEIVADLLSDERVRKSLDYVRSDQVQDRTGTHPSGGRRPPEDVRKRYRPKRRTPETAARERELTLRLAEVEAEAAELRIRLSELLDRKRLRSGLRSKTYKSRLHAKDIRSWLARGASRLRVVRGPQTVVHNPLGLIFPKPAGVRDAPVGAQLPTRRRPLPDPFHKPCMTLVCYRLLPLVIGDRIV